MVAFSSATKNGMMECGKFHTMRLIYAEKASSCILYFHGGRATTMNFPTMQRLTGHDNTPDAPGQATSTGDSLAGRPASWWYFAAEQPRVAGLPFRHTRRRRMWSASRDGWWRACWSGKLTMIICSLGALRFPVDPYLSPN